MILLTLQYFAAEIFAGAFRRFAAAKDLVQPTGLLRGVQNSES